MTAARVRDFAAYTAIGVVFVLAVVWTAARDVDSKWLVLALETCVVWVSAIAQSRRLWRYGALWLALGGSLVVHLAAFGIALHEFKRIEPSVLTYAGAAAAVAEMAQ